MCKKKRHVQRPVELRSHDLEAWDMRDELSNDFIKEWDNYSDTIKKMAHMMIHYKVEQVVREEEMTKRGYHLSKMESKVRVKTPRRSTSHKRWMHSKRAATIVDRKGISLQIVLRKMKRMDVHLPCLECWSGWALLCVDDGAQSGKLNSNWILLNNCSSCQIAINRQILTNVKRVKSTLYLHCQVGTTTMQHKVNLGSLDVWFSPGIGVANILSQQAKEARVWH